MIEPPPELQVLVVDDDEDQRTLLRTLFARAGHSGIVEAADGAEALTIAVEHQPDLIVLDLAMPVRSGVEILPDLRANVPDARVVVLSGFQRRRLERVVRERGAVGYVEKRTPAPQLVRSILAAAALAAEVATRLAVSLPSDPGSPKKARRFVRDALHRDDERLIESVELLVSELVTNAILHASSAPTLAVDVGISGVRIEVFDDDPTPPTPRSPEPTTPGGRGLLLLDRLASRWGVDPHEQGKVVWFELDRPGASASPSPG